MPRTIRIIPITAVGFMDLNGSLQQTRRVVSHEGESSNRALLLRARRFFGALMKANAPLRRVRRRQEQGAQLLNDLAQGVVVVQQGLFDLLQARLESCIGQ